ncbi:DUF3349 domain-containing protein [Pseudonocardia sp. GCM10023141]|uniref:DUF3349 domain-containing protein n=1 Tax=Pseudonocardia sp. GCM10023141 TaxID=3252653 RepID=UPI003606E73D
MASCGLPRRPPPQDHLPLVALLGSQLSDADVTAIADELADKGDPATADAIRDAAGRIGGARPTDSDVARVRAGPPRRRQMAPRRPPSRGPHAFEFADRTAPPPPTLILPLVPDFPLGAAHGFDLAQLRPGTDGFTPPSSHSPPR